MQVLALNQHELEWLSNHLGHELEIHKQVYRIHDNTVEAGKVSKLLVALEQGKVSNLKGKSLDEIREDGKSFTLVIRI